MSTPLYRRIAAELRHAISRGELPPGGQLPTEQELGDREGQAYCLTDLGIVHQRQGRHDQALACLRESLDLYRQLGAPYGQAESLRELGMVLRALGHAEEARAHLRQALALFEQLQTADADQVRALLAE
jgi:tetratricopeptide (TPR) repeat protein